MEKLMRNDLVRVIGFCKDESDEEHTKVGNTLIGQEAVIVDFYSRDKSKEYNIKIEFLDDEMNDLASEYGFDCWDNSELELVYRKVGILMENIKFAIEYLKNNSNKMVEENNNYAVQTCNLAIRALEIQEKICEVISEIDRKYDNYDVMLVIEIKDILNELIID